MPQRSIAPPSAAPHDRRIDRASAALAGLLLGVFIVVLGRVVQLQMAPSVELREHVGQRVTSRLLPALRGELLDRRARVLAGSRFGYSVAVDPVRFPNPPGVALVDLADAIGEPVDVIAERIVTRMERNAQAQAVAARPLRRGLCRYVSVGGVLEDWRVDAVRTLSIPGVSLELRSVREVTDAPMIAPVIGKVGVDANGLAGAELMVDSLIRAREGRFTCVRDVRARPLWLDPDGYEPAVGGESVRLSVDLELQRIASEELERGMIEANAAGGRLVMIDPVAGEVLAIIDLVRELPELVEFDWTAPRSEDAPRVRYRTVRPDPIRGSEACLARNRCAMDVYEPGSTFKPLVWAALTDAGIADIDETIDTEGGAWRTPYRRTIMDVTRRDEMTWSEVLTRSSNIGMAKVAHRVSPSVMRSIVTSYGFETATGTGIPGESAGLITSLRGWNKFTHSSVAMGHEIGVTPMQMVRAFSVLARSGELAGTLPDLSMLADDDRPMPRRARLISERTVADARAAMALVAQKIDDRMEREGAGPFAYTMFGKSGTAEIPLGAPPEGMTIPRGMKAYFEDQYYSSFIAAAPIERPRIALVVVIDDPGPETIERREHYGSWVAGPVVRRVVERTLRYMGVAPTEESL